MSEQQYVVRQLFFADCQIWNTERPEFGQYGDAAIHNQCSILVYAK